MAVTLTATAIGADRLWRQNACTGTGSAVSDPAICGFSLVDLAELTGSQNRETQKRTHTTTNEASQPGRSKPQRRISRPARRELFVDHSWAHPSTTAKMSSRCV